MNTWKIKKDSCNELTGQTHFAMTPL